MKDILHQSIVLCPNCGEKIDVNEAIYHQLEEKLKLDFEKKSNESEEQLKIKQREIDLEKEKIEIEKNQLNDTIQKMVANQLKTEKSILELNIKKKIEEEVSDELSNLQKELNEKSEQVKDLNKSKAEIEKLKREKDEIVDKINLEKELELSVIKRELKEQSNLQIAEKIQEIQKQNDDSNQMKMKELEKKLEDQNKLIDEMKRKAEQGSIQLQGEVMELAIEEWLRINFPLDSVTEIKKGARGADCLQIVNTYTKQNCGTIYYESKRTKDFQSTWIEKFKQDIRDKNATFGVLITDVLPKEMERFGQKDGIWICKFEEFKGLSFVLRESIILLDKVQSSQENKGDKMNLLYTYLTGNEFKLQIEAIVDGFVQMQSDLDKERRAMESIWKQREKQIQKVLLNTTQMYGSIKGIAGTSIGSINQLELPEYED